MYQNPLTNRIIELLVPLVGKVMAESVIKVQTQKLGIDPEKMTAGDLATIADKFSTHIRIFVGTEKARQIGEMIRELA